MASIAAKKAGSKIPADLLQKFDELCAKDTDAQAEFFLTSFIFVLGDDWKKVVELSKTFKIYLGDLGEAHDLNPVQASDFLQKQGRTRTGLERKQELTDIDLNFDGRICFAEYCLLHYKTAILGAYYERVKKDSPFDLSGTGVGITGVGFELLDELFTLPEGLPAELKAAIEAFFATKRAREKRMKTLGEKAKLPGVKGLTAKNELAQMNAKDLTEMNRLEITLNAAKRRAAKSSGTEALEKKKKAEAKAKADAKAASRSRLAARAAMFGGVKKTNGGESAKAAAISRTRRLSAMRR